MLLPVFLVGKNITRNQARYWSDAGVLMPLGRGVYIENPEHHPEMATATAAQKAEAINATLRRFAMRIANKICPEGVVCWAAAQGQEPRDGVVAVYSANRSALLVLDELLEHLSPEVASHVKPLRIRRVRARMESLISGRDYEERDYDDGFEAMPEAGRYLEGRNPPTEQRYRATTPRRTILDVVRNQGEEGAKVDDKGFRALALEAGLPTEGRNLPARIRAALEALRQEFPVMPGEVYERLGDQLMRLSRKPVPNPAGMEKERFVLRWHGVVIGQLVCRHDDKWMFYYEPGWRLRLWEEPKGGMFPPFLSGLFPEQRKFSPTDRVDFLRQYTRLMSNLTITRAGDPPPAWTEDRLQQSLEKAPADGPMFAGRLEGMPAFDVQFLENARRIMLSTAATQISGAQIKVPMELRDGVLRTAENGAFTHILKLPMDNRMRPLPLYEWLGMSLMRAAGVEVPAFRLVPLTSLAAEPLKGRRTLVAMGDMLDRVAKGDMDPEPPEAAVQRLSETLAEAGRKEEEPLIREEVWDELYRLATKDVDGPFQALSADTLARQAPPAYLVERFDIPRPDDGRWRLAEDFCSLTGRMSDVSPEVKYAGTMEEIAMILKRHSTQWPQDARRLFRQVAGNVLVCNTDAHLKNYSLLRIASPERDRIEEVRLAPAYDVTAMASLVQGLGRQALPMYGDTQPNRETLLHYATEACEIPAAEAEAIINQMAFAMEAALPKLLDALPADVKDDPGLWDGLQQAAHYIQVSCRRLRGHQARKSLAPGMRMEGMS